MYDFVVVGAGPVGSRFARQAARSGADVVVFEQGQIGEPLACSGHVSLDLWDYVPESAHNELFQNDIYGARFHLDGPGSKAYPFYKDEPVSNAIDRVGLDKTLAAVARDAGAEILEQHSVTEITEHNDRVSVTVKGPTETRPVQARMIAGCDGPRSRTRRALNLSEPDEFLHGVLGFDAGPDHEDFVDVHLTVPGFFAWRIPRGEAGVEYGLATTPGEAVGDRFDSFVTDYGADIHRRCSGAIPIGAPTEVTSRRGFLVGDAAGQTKPFTGGGILYGMTAADVAARTIDPTDPATLRKYEHGWRAELQREQWLGALVRRAYALPPSLQRIGMQIFSGKIGVHMDRPTSLFSPDQMRALFSR